MATDQFVWDPTTATSSFNPAATLPADWKPGDILPDNWFGTDPTSLPHQYADTEPTEEMFHVTFPEYQRREEYGRGNDFRIIRGYQGEPTGPELFHYNELETVQSRYRDMSADELEEASQRLAELQSSNRPISEDDRTYTLSSGATVEFRNQTGGRHDNFRGVSLVRGNQAFERGYRTYLAETDYNNAIIAAEDYQRALGNIETQRLTAETAFERARTRRTQGQAARAEEIAGRRERQSVLNLQGTATTRAAERSSVLASAAQAYATEGDPGIQSLEDQPGVVPYRSRGRYVNEQRTIDEDEDEESASIIAAQRRAGVGGL